MEWQNAAVDQHIILAVRFSKDLYDVNYKVTMKRRWGKKVTSASNRFNVLNTVTGSSVISYSAFKEYSKMETLLNNKHTGNLLNLTEEHIASLLYASWHQAGFAQLLAKMIAIIPYNKQTEC